MFAVAAALALLLQTEPRRGAVTEALCYLARHQQPDGSWGGRPQACRCPHRREIEPYDEKTVEALLDALRDEDPGKRDDAELRLRALGEAALPRLRKLEGDLDPEVRARGAALCFRINIDHREGSDAELTGLALLAFLGAGYSHFSKDEHDGICFGTVVKRALQWMITRQKESGAFDPEDPVADAVAVLAMSEAYGMTAGQPLQEPAQSGIDRLVAWDPEDARGLFWKGSALKSAELSELAFPKSAYESLDAIRALPGDLALAGRTVLSIYVKRNRADPILGEFLRLGPPIRDTETRYVATLAAYQLDGPSGPIWKGWCRDNQATLLPRQQFEGACPRGSWDGNADRSRLRVTALSALHFEFYHR